MDLLEIDYYLNFKLYGSWGRTHFDFLVDDDFEGVLDDKLVLEIAEKISKEWNLQEKYWVEKVIRDVLFRQT